MEDQYQQQTVTINSVSRIGSLLSLSKGNQTNIRVTLPGSNKVYNTTLEHIHSGGKYLLFKRFSDYLGHTRLMNEKILNVFINLNGADISFTTKMIKLYKDGVNERYVIEMPQSIKYRQRRTAHRVHVSLAMDAKAFVVDQEGRKYTGQLRDISAGGMKVQFTRTDKDKFSKNKTLSNCTIQLPELSDIQCSFKIRHLEENQRKNGFSVGGDFVGIEQTDKRSIEKFVANLERKMLRTIRA